MRIIRFMIWAFIVFFIVGILGFLVAREVQLWIAIRQLESDIQTLGQPSIKETYLQTCAKRGSASGAKFELVFTSSTEYQLQAICESFSFDPLIIDTKTLPIFISKVPGTSGFSYSAGGSVALTAFSDQIMQLKSIGLRPQVVRVLTRTRATTWDGLQHARTSEASTDYGVGPVTSCEGFGYFCCQDQSQIGVGTQLSGTTNCEKSCFSSCQARPVILSMVTDPFFAPQTRTLSIIRGTPMTLGLVIDPSGAKEILGTVDFGDGTTQTFTTPKAELTHTYTCAQASCNYTLQVSVVDDKGNASAPTNTSMLNILVQ